MADPTSPVRLPRDEGVAGGRGLRAPTPFAVAVAILFNPSVI